MKIEIRHANPGYPATAHVAASGGYAAVQAADGQTVERCIHGSASAVVHELQAGESVEAAEDRALARMWQGYCYAAGGKTFDGKPLPTWAELGDERQACWRAALRAI